MFRRSIFGHLPDVKRKGQNRLRSINGFTVCFRENCRVDAPYVKTYATLGYL